MIRSFFIECLLWATCHAQALSPLPEQMTSIPPGGLLTAEFTQNKHFKGISRPFVSQGKITFWQGHGLIWNTQSPFPSLLILTPQGLQNVEEDHPSKQSIPQQGLFFTLMSKVLGGEFENIQGFEVTSHSNSTDHWEVTLTPRQEDLTRIFHSITLTGGKYLAQITLRRPQGDVDEIQFSGHKIVETSAINTILSPKEKTWLQDG